MSKVRHQGVDHEAVFKVVPSLIKLETLLLLWCSPYMVVIL
jgi:hypothetical protein